MVRSKFLFTHDKQRTADTTATVVDKRVENQRDKSDAEEEAEQPPSRSVVIRHAWPYDHGSSFTQIKTAAKELADEWNVS